MKTPPIIAAATALFMIASSSCGPGMLNPNCQPIKKVEISPEVGLAAGSITALKLPVSYEFYEVRGANACVVRDLQKGLVRDFESAKDGKIAWGDYNRIRKETLSLIKELQGVTTSPSGGDRPSSGSASQAVVIDKIKAFNAKNQY